MIIEEVKDATDDVSCDGDVTDVDIDVDVDGRALDAKKPPTALAVLAWACLPPFLLTRFAGPDTKCDGTGTSSDALRSMIG